MYVYIYEDRYYFFHRLILLSLKSLEAAAARA